MEENKNYTSISQENAEENSTFDFNTIFTMLILNWKWFVLSIIICLGLAVVYLKLATPKYQVYAKFLIKDEENNKLGGAGSSLLNETSLGFITNSNGFDNEMEILGSRMLSINVIKELKLYTSYYKANGLKDSILYRTQPITVEIDSAHLAKLGNAEIHLTITKRENGYEVEGAYTTPLQEGAVGEEVEVNHNFTKLPATLNTGAGILTLKDNGLAMEVGDKEKVDIISPENMADNYMEQMSAEQTSKTTTIAQLTLTETSMSRAQDYLNQLALCYNEQANEDKNEIAIRTEAFINSRLEKINAELGVTEGSLEKYKKQNRVVELQLNAESAITNAEQFSQKLAQAETQLALLASLKEYMEEPHNKYQTLPSNVGLTDESATQLIAKYNEIVLERNRLLRTASESSPSVLPLTSQLDHLYTSIQRAMEQSRRSLRIERDNIASQFGKYQGQVGQTPEQERTLNEIGRQQEVRSGLYLMLLQKREENSINLAATADKGKLIDGPTVEGKVSPKTPIILMVALVLGLGIPFGILFLLEFFRYKIDGHEDVEKLTKLPILGDVAVASESSKGRAEIVVHENVNNMMEEIFRSMRTNLQFMLKEGEKTIMFTSSTSGEGKTFVASNLAICFALLGKKVVLIGLDIRKPRLADLFRIDNKHTGITNLLVKSNVTWEDIQKQILPSEVNANMDLLMAGPVPPNPAELLSRPTLDKIFEILREHYDYILVDTAPVGLVTDTLHISRVANITAYVTRADYTPKENILMVNKLAEDGKLPNVSIIINGIDMSLNKNSFRYGYGKYGKYGKYGHYGHYGHYGSYGSYGNYSNSHYGNANDNSIKK